MITYTKEIKLYSFPELGKEAVEKVKEWYLNDEFRCQELSSLYEEELKYLFPSSELGVLYSLSSSQGDGVNVYGNLNLNDVFELPEKGESYKWMKGFLTKKEIRTIKFYMKKYKDTVAVPVNRRYTYCMVDRIDLINDFLSALENMEVCNINTKTLRKLEQMVQQILGRICIEFEKEGYEFLNEVSEDELRDFCESNNYCFLEDGTFCNYIEKNKQKEQKNQRNQKNNNWIISIANEAADGIVMYQFSGTEEEIKKKLFKFIEEDKISDKENYEGGTASLEEIVSNKQGTLQGYSRYSYYHVTYAVQMMKCIENTYA